MKKLLFGLAALPFVAGVASAADRLSDRQMDQVTAGDLPVILCPACISSGSTSTDGAGATISFGNFSAQFASLLAAYYVHLADKGYPQGP